MTSNMFYNNSNNTEVTFTRKSTFVYQMYMYFLNSDNWEHYFIMRLKSIFYNILLCHEGVNFDPP